MLSRRSDNTIFTERTFLTPRRLNGQLLHGWQRHLGEFIKYYQSNYTSFARSINHLRDMSNFVPSNRSKHKRRYLFPANLSKSFPFRITSDHDVKEFYMQKKTRIGIERRLLKDSVFFEENKCRDVPRLYWNELKLGNQLGAGQFGRVYEILSFQRSQDREDSSNETTQKSDAICSFSWPSTSLIESPRDASRQKHFLGGSGTSCDRNDNSPLSSPTSSLMVPRQYSYFLNPDLSGLGDSFDEKNSEENHSDLERQLVYLTLHVRDDGKPRYALKTLRGDLEKHKKNIASMDLACEAKFLLALPHLNIIQVRAIVGHVGKPNHFGIVMDRLLGTLGENIVKWKEAVNPHSKILDRACWRRVRHVSKRPRCVQSIWSKVTCKQQPRPPHDDGLFSERISALSDVARAMSFVHSKRILFRDLKPQNVGITVEGVYVIFDFGLAKELKVVDLVEEPDRYEATGLTGSRIFMAPEVATCQPYGFASDVFSFSMLMWEVIALDEVYQHMSVNEHFEKVILGGLRPKSLRRELPQSLNVMMELSWATDPRERPTFEAILRTLETSCESKDDDQCIFWSE